jgi:hypothetical protein
VQRRRLGRGCDRLPVLSGNPLHESEHLLPANLRGVPTYAYPLYEIAAEALLLATLWLFRDRLRQRPAGASPASAA